MTMERSFVNYEEGFAVCCWEAPSRDELRQLFMKAGAAFDRIIGVEELTHG